MRKLLIIAAIFWFNPLVSSVDVLPDLIGYLLVMKAFSKQAYICDYADDCCVAAKKMCIVSGVKLLSVTMVTAFDPTMSLLFSVVFGIVECVFGIPFFIKLFNAYSHMIPAESGEICTLVETKLKRFTIVAFVLRLVLAFMPDLTALSLNTAFTYDVDYTYYRFKPLFIGFCVIIALVINIIWS